MHDEGANLWAMRQDDIVQDRPLTRSVYAARLWELHRVHIERTRWRLEFCEYCRAEYYMEVSPLLLPPFTDADEEPDNEPASGSRTTDLRHSRRERRNQA